MNEENLEVGMKLIRRYEAARERIAKLEAENAALKAYNDRLLLDNAILSAPVSDEEADQPHDDWGVPFWYRADVDAFIADRVKRLKESQ